MLNAFIDTVSKYFKGGNFYEESYIIHNSNHNLVSVDFRDIFAEETFNGTAEGHNGPVSVAVKSETAESSSKQKLLRTSRLKESLTGQSQKFRSAFWRLNRCKLT